LLLNAGACSTAPAAIFCLQGAGQQTHQPLLLLSIDGTDGRTDRRTPDRYKDPAEHTGSVNNNVTGAVRTQNRNYKNETDRPNAEIS